MVDTHGRIPLVGIAGKLEPLGTPHQEDHERTGWQMRNAWEQTEDWETEKKRNVHRVSSPRRTPVTSNASSKNYFESDTRRISATSDSHGIMEKAQEQEYRPPAVRISTTGYGTYPGALQAPVNWQSEEPHDYEQWRSRMGREEREDEEEGRGGENVEDIDVDAAVPLALLAPLPEVQETTPVTSPPPSPRYHINDLQQRQTTPTHLTLPQNYGPLDIFLAQDDTEDNPVRRAEDRSRLSALRADIFRLRLQLKTSHKELREKEFIKASADEALLKFVRRNMELPALLSQKGLVEPLNESLDVEQYLALMKALQIARDEYGPLDDDFHRLVDSLDKAEFELAQIEARFYTYQSLAIPDSSNSDTPPHKISASSPQSDLGMTWEDHTKYDPVHIEYLSRLGDLDLAYERYNNTKNEEESLFQDQERKAQYGIPFAEDLKLFLEQLPSRHEKLESEISSIGLDVERLRAVCLEKGIEPDEQTDSSTTDDRESQQHQQDTSTRYLEYPKSDHNYSMFPLLFPKSLKEKASLEILITEFDESNKSDRINRWIQFGMQTSPLQVDILVQIFLDAMKMIDFGNWKTDIHQWQASVLFAWSTDGTNLPAEAFEMAQTRNSLSNSFKSTVLKRASFEYVLVFKSYSAPGSLYGRTYCNLKS